MPIYEFYCPDCHTIFNFFSRRVNTDKRPSCPRCGRPELSRQVSLFAISRGRTEDTDGMPDLDDAQLERVMASMAGEVENIDEDDPRQAAQVMRKLFDATGLALTPAMEEAIHRMEQGEDPDRIEEELGDVLESEDPFALAGKKGSIGDLRRRLLPPKVDDTLYDL
jgi:putative FmdB family regulatory protein